MNKKLLIVGGLGALLGFAFWQSRQKTSNWGSGFQYGGNFGGVSNVEVDYSASAEGNVSVKIDPDQTSVLPAPSWRVKSPIRAVLSTVVRAVSPPAAAVFDVAVGGAGESYGVPVPTVRPQGGLAYQQSNTPYVNVNLTDWGELMGSEDHTKDTAITREVVKDLSVADTIYQAIVRPVKNVVISPESELLSLIRKAEGTADFDVAKYGYASGYDVTLGYGKFADDKVKRITSMTLSEVYAHQKKMKQHPDNKFWKGRPSSAVGAYQVVEGTLADAQAGLLAPSSQRYDDDFQDRVAVWLLKNRRGYGRFLNDKNVAAFQKRLAGEWASLPKDASNQSQYGGKARITSDQLRTVLNRF